MKRRILLITVAIFILGTIANATIVRIEAEDFDSGGEGVAYHDTTPGSNGPVQYRSESDVDLADCLDIDGRYCVGWIATGEWLNYTIDVPVGTYDIGVRLAAWNNEAFFHLELNGNDISGTLNPNTGGKQIWTTVLIQEVTFSSGPQTITFVNDSEGERLNFNYIEVASVPEPTTLLLLGLGGLLIRKR